MCLPCCLPLEMGGHTGPPLQLKLQDPPRNHDRCPTDPHFFNFPCLTLHFQTNAAGAIDKISLLDHKLVNSINWIDVRGAMMNQITAERPAALPVAGSSPMFIPTKNRACARASPISSVSRVNA